MLDITDTKSLTDFNRNSREHVERLKQSGKPQLLTVKGEAAVVVQDAAAYQELLNEAEYARSVKAVQAGMAAHKRGGGVDFLEALEAIADEHGVKLTNRKKRA